MKHSPRLTISSASIDPKTASKTISNMPNVHNRTPQGLTLSRFNNMYNIWLT